MYRAKTSSNLANVYEVTPNRTVTRIYLRGTPAFCLSRASLSPYLKAYLTLVINIDGNDRKTFFQFCGRPATLLYVCKELLYIINEISFRQESHI